MNKNAWKYSRSVWSNVMLILSQSFTYVNDLNCCQRKCFLRQSCCATKTKSRERSDCFSDVRTEATKSLSSVVQSLSLPRVNVSLWESHFLGKLLSHNSEILESDYCWPCAWTWCSSIFMNNKWLFIYKHLIQI